MLKQSKIVYGGLRALARELAKEEWRDAKYIIVLDENTFQHCLPVLIPAVEQLQEAEFVEVPVGEECKSLEVAAQVWQTLLEGDADRQTVLVNLGGGAVCDLGGFVAAGYKRGIRHINIPTTLLAMADAAIGGKTAVDFGGVKNSIGHFYPAVLTVIDTVFLDTLPPIELLNGSVEMLKTAAVTDPTLYHQILTTLHNTPLSSPLEGGWGVKSSSPLPGSEGDTACDRSGAKLGEGDRSEGVVEECVNSPFSTLRSPLSTLHSPLLQVSRLKARIVKADPYDRSIRKILNFGHTFGHAIEQYRGLPHGLAVALGMKAAMYLSTKKTGLPEEVYHEYSQWLAPLLSTLHSPLSTFHLKDAEQLLALMRHDKKNARGGIRCVLLQELGAAMIDVEISDNEVRDALLKLGR